MEKYSFEDYSSAMKALRDELHAAQDELIREEFSYKKDNAEDDYLKKTRDAYVSYRLSTNPYSKEREGMTSKGLGSSGKDRISLQNDFSEYQSYLSRAFTEREDILKELVGNLVKAQSENDYQRLSGYMDDAKAKMDNYWKEYSWAYQKERDELEDKRYEKELKAKYGI